MNKDIDRLQGNWRLKSLVVDGAALSAGMIGQARVSIDGQRFRSLGMGSTFEGLMHVDHGRKPKSFSIKFTRGPEKGNVNHGIYELKGDKWRLCIATRGGPPPSDFESKPGSGFAIEVLERDVDPAAAVA